VLLFYWRCRYQQINLIFLIVLNHGALLIAVSSTGQARIRNTRRSARSATASMHIQRSIEAESAEGSSALASEGLHKIQPAGLAHRLDFCVIAEETGL